MAFLASRLPIKIDGNDTATPLEQIPVREAVISASLNEQKTGEEGISMVREVHTKLTRGQLYDEVWEISVAGAARKYGIQYGYLLKQIKEAAIPIPSFGYWANLRMGKSVTKSELSGTADDIIALYKLVASERIEQAKDESQ